MLKNNFKTKIITLKAGIHLCILDTRKCMKQVVEIILINTFQGVCKTASFLLFLIFFHCFSDTKCMFMKYHVMFECIYTLCNIQIRLNTLLIF